MDRYSPFIDREEYCTENSILPVCKLIGAEVELHLRAYRRVYDCMVLLKPFFDDGVVFRFGDIFAHSSGCMVSKRVVIVAAELARWLASDRLA